MSEFAKLVAELDASDAPLKAMPAPTEEDAKVKAAAADAGATDTTTEDGGEGGEQKPDPDEEDPEMMGKSFSVTLADGSTVDAIDGTAFVKALSNKVEVFGGFIERLVDMNKALVLRVQHDEEMITGQTAMIKSLQADVAKFGNQGSGRRTVLNVTEKLPATPAVPERPAFDDVMAKALSLQEAGKFTGLDVSRTAGYLRKGEKLPPDLASALIS